MTLVVRKTDDKEDIYHQYFDAHCERPWKHAVSCNRSRWLSAGEERRSVIPHGRATGSDQFAMRWQEEMTSI
jgi:hypothetical protein